MWINFICFLIGYINAFCLKSPILTVFIQNIPPFCKICLDNYKKVSWGFYEGQIIQNWKVSQWYSMWDSVPFDISVKFFQLSKILKYHFSGVKQCWMCLRKRWIKKRKEEKKNITTRSICCTSMRTKSPKLPCDELLVRPPRSAEIDRVSPCGFSALIGIMPRSTDFVLFLDRPRRRRRVPKKSRFFLLRPRSESWTLESIECWWGKPLMLWFMGCIPWPIVLG